MSRLVPAVIGRPSLVVMGILIAANFPDSWAFDGVTCGTPGNYPDGADYGVRFKGKGPAYVVGRLREISDNPKDAARD